jgi:hypothetical protein
VGLTAFAAGSGLVVRVRGGLGIPTAVAPRPLRILGPTGRPISASVQACGAGCAEAFLPTPPRGLLTVLAALPGGAARFQVPVPLPPSGEARLYAADQALARSGSYRIHEVLDSASARWSAATTCWRRLTGPAGTPTAARAPPIPSGSARPTTPATIAARGRRRPPPGLTLKFPARNWSDREANVVDLGPARLGATSVRVLAFIDAANGAYHRLWVDRANRILRERMESPGHFMTRDYAGYGAPVTMTPPPPP